MQVLLLAIRLLGMRTASLREQKTANYVNYSVGNGLQQLKHPFAMLSHLHKEQEGVDFVGLVYSFFILKKFHRLCHLFICPDGITIFCGIRCGRGRLVMESWTGAVMMLLPVVCHAALASKNEAQPYGVLPIPPK